MNFLYGRMYYLVYSNVWNKGFELKIELNAAAAGYHKAAILDLYCAMQNSHRMFYPKV